LILNIAIVATFTLHGLPRRTLLFGLLALLICWSRVFVGTHYLTDVLGGSLTGAVAAILAWGFYREGPGLIAVLRGSCDTARCQ
jgi:undecaprenyl-diphosphatase